MIKYWYEKKILIYNFVFLMPDNKSNVSYFSHDCNARNDEKLMMIRAKFWRWWYWQYFAIIEMLSEATWYKLEKKMISVITSLYQIDNDLITTLLDTGLLAQSDDFFWSESLLKRMYMRDNKTKKCSEAWVKGMKKRRLKKKENNASSDEDKNKVVITINEINKINEINWNNILSGTPDYPKKNLGDNKSEIKDKKKNKEEENKINIKNKIETIIWYLNKASGKNFKPNSEKAVKFTTMRINEGYELADFYKAIDNQVKEWRRTDMRQYLRPETLFGNKFDWYVNASSAEKNKTIDDFVAEAETNWWDFISKNYWLDKRKEVYQAWMDKQALSSLNW